MASLDTLYRLEEVNLLLEDDLIPTRQWKKVISKCKKEGIKTIVFNLRHNNPRKDLLELIEFAKDFHTRLVIDGRFLTKLYCESLKEAGLCEISTILYSFLALAHGSITGDDSFSYVTMGIKNVIKLNQKLTVHIPICKVNYKSVNETIRYLYGLGVRNIVISVYTEGNAFFKNTVLTKPELIEVLENAVSISKEFKDLFFNFDGPGWVDEIELIKLHLPTPTCKACLTKLSVLRNGDVVPCSSGISVNTVLDNIFYSSWKKVKSSFNYKAIRDHSFSQPDKCPYLRFIEASKCTEQR